MTLITKRASLHQVLGSPLYRGATIAMFLSGVGTSAAAPQILLFLVSELARRQGDAAWCPASI